MDHRLEVFADHRALARAAASHVADLARAAVSRSGTFHVAVSGGRSPWEMFGALARLAMPWAQTVVYQVDERVAPADDPERNLGHLHRALGDVAVEIRAMPVEDDDLDAAADRYAAALPDQFDLVHLGIGPDGHTASLVPGDPVLDVTDRLVAVTTAPYKGTRRMTLTYPALSRARQLLWLVSGEDKRGPLARTLAGDPAIPAGRVEAASSLVLADRDAVPSGT